MKIFSLIALVIVVLLNPLPAFAHLAGQPPYFKVDGIYSGLYPVPTTSLENFDLPQDLAPKNYLVNEKIDFEIDKSQIPVLPSVIEKTTFHWDFADGQKGEGIKNSHSYSKPGSYHLKIMAQYQNDQPQLLQSTLINILPNDQFELPKAVIAVNGITPSDPLTDPIATKLNQEFTFDASKSVSNSKIIEYTWDFGDGETSNQPTVKHKFAKNYPQFFPVLRIKTEDGYIADTFLEMKEGEGILAKASAPVQGSLKTAVYGTKEKIATGVFIVILVAGIFFGFKRLKSKVK